MLIVSSTQSNSRSSLSNLLLQKLKIIQLIPVLHDVLLDLASHCPGHKVLRRPRDEIGRISDHIRTDSHVALLDHLRRRLDILRHPQSRHDDWQASSGECCDGQLVLDGAELRTCFDDAHVVELVEEQFFMFATDGIVWGEEGEAVGELAERLRRGGGVSACLGLCKSCLGGGSK